MIKINQDSLDKISAGVSVPLYNRKDVKAGIVHIGVGGFHRAHQAFYMNELLNRHQYMDWGICGICLLKRYRMIYDVLIIQGGLYTLIVKGKSNLPLSTVIGSIVEYYFAPDDPLLITNKTIFGK